MDLIKVHQRIKKINKELVAAQAVEKNKRLIIRLNLSQLRNSKLSTGAAIVPLYSDAYALKKGTRKPNLKLSGKMDEETEVTITKKEYFIASSVDYARYNVMRYSVKIWGLTKESKEKAKPTVSASFIKIWKHEAGL